MGWLLRLQPVARVGLTGRLDTTASALRRLGPVEDVWQPLSENSVASRSPIRWPVRPSSVQRDPGGSVRRVRCIAPSATNAARIVACFPWRRWRALNPPNRRGTDPYARWCGRGGIVRCPPIPIDGREHGVTLDQVGASVLPGHDSFRGLIVAATWHWRGRHPHVPNAVTASGPQRRSAGLPGLVPAGTSFTFSGGTWAAKRQHGKHQAAIAASP
jgi:hypothetical protein